MQINRHPYRRGIPRQIHDSFSLVFFNILIYFFICWVDQKQATWLFFSFCLNGLGRYKISNDSLNFFVGTMIFRIIWWAVEIWPTNFKLWWEIIEARTFRHEFIYLESECYRNYEGPAVAYKFFGICVCVTFVWKSENIRCVESGHGFEYSSKEGGGGRITQFGIDGDESRAA